MQVRERNKSLSKLIYIIGQFRASTTWGIECNVRVAETYALRIWKMGHVAVCPHLNSRFFHGELPDSTFLEGDLLILSKCDAVLAITGWIRSKGAQNEVKYAKDQNIPVFYSLQGLKLELNKQRKTSHENPIDPSPHIV